MYGDVGVVAETFFQLVLDGGGAVVDHGERQTTVHAYMSLDGDAASYAPRVQVMRLVYIGH